MAISKSERFSIKGARMKVAISMYRGANMGSWRTLDCDSLGLLSVMGPPPAG
jgi:hypothetical protein